MTATHDDVDGSDDPQGAGDCQERVDAWPQVQAYKRHSFEQLRGETHVLDLGCGPGQDAAAVSAEESVGVDRSWAMCTRALPRVGRVCQGLAEQLPFADAAFGGCRANRVLVHLADPLRALHELLRVTRPGGRIVVADPDDAFGLASWVTGWREHGGFDDRDVAEWDTAITRARAAGMIDALLYFVVAGTTP